MDTLEETPIADISATYLTDEQFNSLYPKHPIDVSNCCDMGQNDTIGKIELIPLFVLSSDNTNCKNDIQ